MGRLLSQLGVKESDLLSAIRVVDTEPTSALERAVERAYRLAKSTGAAQVLPAHLLLAIARDSRSAGHRSLEVIGAGSRRVQEAVQAALQPEDAHTAPTSTYIGPPASFPAQPEPKPFRPSARRTAEPVPLIELRVEKPEQEPSIELPVEEPVEALEDELIVPSSSPFALDAGKYPTLAKLGRNLTEMASLGRIDEVTFWLAGARTIRFSSDRLGWARPRSPKVSRAGWRKAAKAYVASKARFSSSFPQVGWCPVLGCVARFPSGCAGSSSR
jgi:ATP-dependent Clp protease ATP-binding subunit ClpA